MCDICGRTPCHPRCPNAIENPIGHCSECGAPIITTYDYYTDNEDNIFCSEDCYIKYYGIVKK